MSNRPDGHTSNYGWALWHLEQAETAPAPDVALVYLAAAQARATLAAIDCTIEQRFDGSTWTTPTHKEKTA